ncbi:winged helix-turn-helix domain-containing protein [Fuchsiella alkaliacetigena]|uniref:winged helix-turn-helix domain-containing protein n=1 Tax=Fuchsiella alkaliacetigena TaxID=957042 RepID=UPI00200A9AFC|nr:LysR family transcriptional regulator [Fuchsiella alkaliacetigena]MCK8824795.1 LysR family transcriptional regulator [Fuchsiella alkaliacetigena]
MKLNYKLWLENEEGELVMGQGLLSMLELIDKTGSISQTAQQLDMSYRAAWGKLNLVEKRLGLKLTKRKSGGKGGGGSILTKEGKDLLLKFKKFDKRVQKELEFLFIDYFDK